MKVVQLKAYGEKDSVSIAQIPKPLANKDSVLIEVFAAGVNPFDYKLQSGVYKNRIPLELPITLGGDIAGRVVEVGSEVNEFQTGDEVYGQASILSKGTGAFAEYVLTLPRSIAPKPRNLSFAEAAALPLTGASAIQALIDTLKLSKDQKILIQGGAGGIGTIAIQIAKRLGAYVATTVSTPDIDYVKELGADTIIDYKTEQFENLLSGYDVVYDLVGGETTKRSLNVLKSGGKLVSMVQKVDQSLMESAGVTASVQSTKITRERLTKLMELVELGVVKPRIEKTFSLEETEKALTYLRQTPPKGKVVLKIKS